MGHGWRTLGQSSSEIVVTEVNCDWDELPNPWEIWESCGDWVKIQLSVPFLYQGSTNYSLRTDQMTERLGSLP